MHLNRRCVTYMYDASIKASLHETSSVLKSDQPVVDGYLFELTTLKELDYFLKVPVYFN